MFLKFFFRAILAAGCICLRVSLQNCYGAPGVPPTRLWWDSHLRNFLFDLFVIFFWGWWSQYFKDFLFEVNFQGSGIRRLFEPPGLQNLMFASLLIKDDVFIGTSISGNFSEYARAWFQLLDASLRKVLSRKYETEKQNHATVKAARARWHEWWVWLAFCR